MSAFDDWLRKEHPMIAMATRDKPSDGPFATARNAMEIAWDAALDLAAREMRPMLRDMISRGKAADNCRALKIEGHVKGTENGR